MELDYQIVRSARRKTAAIKVTDEGVVVRVPQWVSDEWVRDWVLSRQDWINHHSQKLKHERDQFCLNLEQGGRIPYLGQHFSLFWQYAKQNRVVKEDKVLKLYLSNRSKKAAKEQVKQLLKQWYKQQALDYLTELLEVNALNMNLNYKGLIIKDFRGRWGSCSSDAEISLNWRLILAEPHLIEYVIVHELAHLRHFNHSPQFWREVEQYCPEWRQFRVELQRRICWLRW